MKRLYRSRKNRVIAGVCGGIAEYLDVDPVPVRLIAVLLLFVGGGSLIAYIVGMIIIPDQPLGFPTNAEPASSQNLVPPPPWQKPGNNGTLIIGAILMLLGTVFLLRNIPFLHQYYWWFWNMGWNFFWPSLLILIGVIIILRATQNSKNGGGQ